MPGVKGVPMNDLRINYDCVPIQVYCARYSGCSSRHGLEVRVLRRILDNNFQQRSAFSTDGPNHSALTQFAEFVGKPV
jgi:hypothetical protein